jgi:Tfp pilus assembly protein PilF
MAYFDLGNWTRKITTHHPEAQLWFDRGLNWLFGFNHEEAIVCFEKTLEADPNCVMAHWGIAHCIGPNYNKCGSSTAPGKKSRLWTGRTGR